MITLLGRPPAAPFLTITHFILFFLFFSPRLAFAYTEITDFLLDDGVHALARGGMRSLPEEQEGLDFTKPVSLNSKADFKIETSYGYQRTFRTYNGGWKGSHAFAEDLQSAVAASFVVPKSGVTGSVAAGYGYRWFDVEASSSEEEINVRSRENFEASSIGIFIDKDQWLKFGASFIQTDYRDSLEVPLQGELSWKRLNFGYRRSYTDIAGDFDIRLSGHSGSIPVRYGEELNELYFVGDFPGILYGKYSHQLNKSGNCIEWRIKLPFSLYLAGQYQRRNRDFLQTFLVEGKDGGYVKGDINLRDNRLALGVEPSPKWGFEINYRRRTLGSTGGGVAYSQAIVDFWPSLLVGNYNHLYDLSIGVDQYSAGMEYKGNNITFRHAINYMYMKTSADLHYWRSVLFGLGSTDVGSLTMNIDRIKLLFLSLGVDYHWKNVTVSYGIGQFIPLGTRETKNEPEGTSSSGSGGGSDFFESLKDKINHNPGGNIQRLLVSITF